MQTGQDIFSYYMSIDGEYKQTLLTAHIQIGDKLFKLLEEAEKQGKKIVIKEDDTGADDAPFSVVIE